MSKTSGSFKNKVLKISKTPKCLEGVSIDFVNQLAGGPMNLIRRSCLENTFLISVLKPYSDIVGKNTITKMFSGTPL